MQSVEGIDRVIADPSDHLAGKRVQAILLAPANYLSM
jgi:hypothetical protein